MPRGFMKKIYQFESNDPHRYVNIEEQQSSPDEIVMKIYCEGMSTS
jgi:hypothetical protein